MMVVVIVMMIVMMVMMMIMMVVVVMVVVLSDDQRLFFRNSDLTALVFSAQNVLSIRNGIQQLGKRSGGLQGVGFVDRGRGGRLRTADKGQCRSAAQEADESLVQVVSFPAYERADT
jgi:hypothetical protein